MTDYTPLGNWPDLFVLRHDRSGNGSPQPIYAASASSREVTLLAKRSNRRRWRPIDSSQSTQEIQGYQSGQRCWSARDSGSRRAKNSATGEWSTPISVQDTKMRILSRPLRSTGSISRIKEHIRITPPRVDSRLPDDALRLSYKEEIDSLLDALLNNRS